MSRYAAHAACHAAELEAARQLAAARIHAAGVRMRLSALRRLDATLTQPIAAGDAVRVSVLALPHVRRQVKSQLVGDALPLFSTSLYRVERVRHDARTGRTLYDIACASCEDEDPLPSVVNGWLAQLPTRLRKVERRHLLRIPPGTRGTMGRTQPNVLPLVYAAPDVVVAPR